MTGARRSCSIYVCAWLAAAIALRPFVALGQLPDTLANPRVPDGPPGQRVGSAMVKSPDASLASQTVVDVRVLGNQATSLPKITREIRTRAGRPFDREQIEEDVRRLTKTRLFVSVDTHYQHAPGGGLIVIFRLVERPTLKYVKYVGNSVREKTITKQTGLKVGDSLDPYMVSDARRKLEDWYVTKGYSKAKITVIEGDKPGDAGVVMLINEGQKQRVQSIEFIGNTIATDGRLKTQIKSKIPYAYLFKGELDRNKIDEDVDRLTTYYRSLGYFRATIGRELQFNEKQNWVTLTFMINEGPRFKIRDVSVIGNKKIPSDVLMKELKLVSGQFFEQAVMDKDVTHLQDKYGSDGYVFAAVEADPRFLEEPGQLDLVYQIQEGSRYKVGAIDIKIQGDNPRTRRHTVLNRIECKPGDIADVRALRDSSRRLKASGLFMNKPADGIEPKITFRQPDLMDDPAANTADSKPRGRKYRGQSPEPPIEAPREGSSPPVIRGQSPGSDPAGSPTYGYGNPLGTSVAGQVPMGRTSPDSPARRIDAWSEPAGSAVVRTQYAQPATPYPTAPAQPLYPPPAAAGPGYPPAASAPQNYPPAGSYPPVGSYPPAGNFQPPVAQPSYVPPQPSASAPTYIPPQSSSIAPYSPPQGFPQGQPYGQPGPYTQPPPVNMPPSQLPQVQPGQLPPPTGYDSGNQLFPNGPMPLPPEDVLQPVDVQAVLQETQTGRFMLGVGVNSNAGLVGSITLDEQNFDWRRWPTSWEDVRNATAFRGGGQQFRIEAIPGTQLSRYTVTFREPYLFDTKVAFGISGSYYQRFFQDWTEARAGGRMNFGYQFTPDLSGTMTLRGENVNIKNPTVPTPPELTAVLGNSQIYSARTDLIHDTRDSTFLPTEGHYVDLGFEYAVGTFHFPRATIDARKHFLLHERPDHSGRQVLNLITNLGYTGGNTPIYENFFAGGYATLRGFYFRGASPQDMNVIVGGKFQWLNSVEYMFPLMADDMLRGVVFCDFGTVEPDFEIHGRDFRVSPGAGLRITIPAMGPAPIALDFACPVMHAAGDHIQNFSFFVGYAR